MKKILLFCFAISALMFTSCDKEDFADEAYKLVVNPSTASISAGNTITFTVVGDGSEQYSWTGCFEPTSDGGSTGSCFVLMNGTLTLDADFFLEGEYKIHAECSDLDAETAYTAFTITE